MQPLAALSPIEASRIHGLATDIDDTILDHGALHAPTLAALWRAHEAGFPVLLATGRSIAFAEVLVRMWPCVGAVAENGALAAVRRDRHGRVLRLDTQAANDRARLRAKLETIVAAVSAAFPSVRLSDDASGRVSDVTFDIGEADVVPREVVREMVKLAEHLGARTTTSSVHLHLTLDHADKATGILHFLANERGVDPTFARGRWAFVGDSSNDAPAFAAFRQTFGVANVRASLDRLVVPPRYLTPSERGAGFVELLDRLVAGRTGQVPLSGGGG
jgi:HAD superfamily hydrolase (TIGR01484 family)